MQPTLSNYERGRRELSVSVALLICGALDIPLGALVPTEAEGSEVIAVRGSKLGRALQTLRERPDLLRAFLSDDPGGGLRIVRDERSGSPR